MKKTLLALFCAGATWAASQAETPSLNFTYAGKPAQCYSLGLAKGTQVSLAFGMPENLVASFAGNEITAVNVTTGVYTIMNTQTNNIRNIEIFITEDLNGTPVYTQSAKLGSSAMTQYTIDLTTPYKIEAGRELFVGYSFAVDDAPANKRSFYVTVDGVPSSDPSCYYGYTANGKKVWSQDASEIGSICMGCVIAGESLPQNGAVVKQLTLPAVITPGQSAEASLTIGGLGARTVESVEVTYALGNEPAVTVPVSLSSPLSFGKSAEVKLSGLKYSSEQLFVTASASITKVNGEANELQASSTATTTFNSYDQTKGFDRMHLIEKSTGTWCGYCPRGIVMMQYAESKYPELFARVALHNGDEMSNSSSNMVINGLQVPGFPYMNIDRNFFAGDPGEYPSVFPSIAANKAKTYVGFTGLEATYDAAGDEISITSKVGTSLACDNAGDRLRVAYYLTEDGVGPYKQTNYYAGGSLGKLDGWETKSSSVSTVYEDVCRLYIGSFNGIAGSLPSSFESGTEYAHSTKANGAVIEGTKFRVIALLIDSQSGEVLNVAQTEAEKSADGAVTEIESAGPVTVSYHDLSGRRVENPAAGTIYIRTERRADGSLRSSKVRM